MRQWATASLTISLATLLLVVPSLMNGFPFLSYDSSYYIARGTAATPGGAFLWRPLTYCLFLKFNLALGSLLFFIVIQNLLLASLLFAAVRHWAPGLKNVHFLWAVVALYLTPFPVYGNFILPDIFSGFVPLGLAAAFTSAQRRRKFAWLGVYLLAVITHYANMLAGSLLLLGALLFNRSRKIATGWAIILMAPWLLVPTLHYFLANRFVVSNSANVYLYSQLSALGIAGEYLNEKCPSHPSPLCATKGPDFQMWQWGPESKIGKAGGLNALLPEIVKANQEILLSTRIFGIVPRTFRRIINQLTNFSEPLTPLRLSQLRLDRDNDKNFITQIASLTNELSKFSLQQTEGLRLKGLLQALALLYRATVLLAGGALGILLFKKKLAPQLCILLFYSLGGYLLNAIICGFLTDPIPRYSGRMIWLFPFILTLHLTLAWSRSVEPVH